MAIYPYETLKNEINAGFPTKSGICTLKYREIKLSFGNTISKKYYFQVRYVKSPTKWLDIPVSVMTL